VKIRSVGRFLPLSAAKTASRTVRRIAWAAWRGRLIRCLFLYLLVPGSGTAGAANPGATGVAPESPRAMHASPPASPSPSPRTISVLVLYPDNRLRPANILFDRSFREKLGALLGASIDCFGEFLDEEHFPASHQERMRDFLRAKYAERLPDVIVTFASPSLEFCARYCSQLFPGVPIVFAAMGANGALRRDLGPRVTGVQSSFDAEATLRLALRLHPRTRQVYVVADATPRDSVVAGETSRNSIVAGETPRDSVVADEATHGSAVADEAAHDSLRVVLESTLRASALHPTLHYLPSQPLAQHLDTLVQLPENSLVIDLSTLGRRGGTAIPPDELEEWMASASRTPVWAACDPLVGQGFVGAVTTPMEVIGQATADMVAQILQHQDADSLPPVQILAATPIFDWRQLRQWGIRTRQLPAGSIVQFKSPSLWEQYSTQLITLSGLFLLQTGLILALVLQSRRRRRAEREAQRRRDELTHMTRVATMGELTASLAHEINQPLAAILSNAQAALRLLAAGGTDNNEIGEILADIAADDRRAGEVIRRMRALLRKGEGDPMVLDVNDLVTEVVGLVRGEMILQNVSLALELSSDLPRVHGDRIQLQQVLLNLMMNALDAMKETSGGNRRVVVRTAVADGRSVQVGVEDSGGGVAAEKLEQIFEPFVTTKAHGMGLGLAICRSIIQAHGGRIGFTNNPDRGANFWFTLPGVEEAKT